MRRFSPNTIAPAQLSPRPACGERVRVRGPRRRCGARTLANDSARSPLKRSSLDKKTPLRAREHQAREVRSMGCSQAKKRDCGSPASGNPPPPGLRPPSPGRGRHAGRGNQARCPLNCPLAPLGRRWPRGKPPSPGLRPPSPRTRGEGNHARRPLNCLVPFRRRWPHGKPPSPGLRPPSPRTRGEGNHAGLLDQTLVPTASRLLSASAVPASSASISRNSLLSVLLRQTAQATPAMQIKPTR